MHWQWVDIAIVSVILLSVITGLFRGLVKELLAFAVWLLAFWLAYHYSYQLEPLLNRYIHDPTICKVIAFIVFLAGVIIAGGLVNTLLSFIIKRSGLSGTDRILGMGFGFVRGVLIVSFLILIIQVTAIPEDYSKTSVLYPKFTPITEWMHGYMPAFIAQAKLFETHHLDEKEST